MLLAARLLRAFCSQSRMTLAWQARAACSLLLLSSVSLLSQQRLSPYERAQQARWALEARPETQRTRAAYERVLDAYRAVSYYDPASPRADASVLGIAELLTEEGRLFSDEKLLQDAIARYESLHLEHPSGGYRFAGQIVEGEKQARIELNELRRRAELRPPSPARAQHNAVPAPAAESQQSAAARAPTSPSIENRPSVAPSRPPPAVTQPITQPSPPPTQMTSVSPEVPSTVLTALHPGQVALVSGIRHWSTPVYTRIAIDLQDQVAYQAARVPGPDRIYFDLYGARLDPGLNGKSTEVIDDGFLKRIRAAQFSNNVTRIVLDVSSVSDYSAFLLPNPWRLIIDIHGLKPGASQTTNLASTPPSTQPPARTPEPSTPPAPPVANSPQPAAVASAAAGRHSGTQEIAALGQQPNRVQATDHPTTRPIAASVAGTVPAPQPDDGSLASTTPPPATAATAPPSKVSSRKSKKPSALHPSPPDTSDADDNLTPPTHEADPTAAGQRSLVRTLGLKIGRIVIDPGHGGHDSGTTGPGGIEEKQVVLDVALRLGKLLKQRLGADVIFTRDNDTFIPLETRTAIANKAQADLFLSIHANSSPDSSARGVETYYLNFTTSPDALEVAARENAVSDESIHELSDLVKKITLKDKIDESREFAADVQKSLYDNLEEGNPGLRDRGIKKAPFVVLIGANMPSILAEISFLTNSDDARQLQQPAYRQRIAESLYRGVSRYISGLSGVRLAQSSGHPNGN
jgi:N-acetylmuramoyl-L-alanine amidase